ncbi:hypothetical protein E3Q11_02754 [Wallemia mellicola]|nr:hypothetical protein E3Q11_02754 [Wallemia mellicola]
MDFFNEFKLDKKELLRLVENATNINDIQSTRAKLGVMQTKFNESADILPAYDQKSYTVQLAELTRILAEKQATVTPAPRFSFRKKSHAKKMNVAQNSPTVQQTPPLEKHLDNTSVVIADISNEVCDKGVLGSLVVRNIESIVARIVRTSGCHAHNIRKCIINFGNIDGSLFLQNITNAIIVANCHQFRMHASENVVVCLKTTSTAVIEDCKGIVFVKHPKSDSIPSVSDFDSPLSSDNFTTSERYNGLDDIFDSLDINHLKFTPH